MYTLSLSRCNIIYMQAIAKQQTVCDSCSKVLTENYSTVNGSQDSVSLYLPVENKNYPNAYKDSMQHHFCDEECLAAHLAERKKGKGKKVAKASMIFTKASVEVDITA